MSVTGPRVVIAGPPGSGKSTRAREIHGEWPDAVLIDFDDIARALGSPAADHHTEPHPPHIAMVAGVAWRAAVLTLIDDPGLPAVIIHADPDTTALIRYAEGGFQLIDTGRTPQ